MKKLLFIAFVSVGVSFNSFAQSSATATASATIVAAISIAKNVDMNFGNVAVSASSGGTVILATNSTRTKTGGITLPQTTGTVAAAKFTVTGQADYAYNVTLPSSAHTIKHASTTDEMTVTAFTSFPATNDLILTGGSQELFVGGTLNVAAAQNPGVYSSVSPFTVTVNYN